MLTGDSMREECRNCEFVASRTIRLLAFKSLRFVCRYNPPERSAWSDLSLFPKVKGSDWCGKFQKTQELKDETLGPHTRLYTA